MTMTDASRQSGTPDPRPDGAERLTVGKVASDRHPFEPDPDGRMVVTGRAAPGRRPAAWPACAQCGKDRRAHPRRSPVNPRPRLVVAGGGGATSTPVVPIAAVDVAAPPKRKSRQVDVVERLGAHAFEPSDDRPRLDKAGRPMRVCRVCGRTGRGSGHRFAGLTGEVSAPATKRPGRALVPVLDPGARNGSSAQPAPSQAPQVRPQARPARGLPAAELVAIAVAIDRVLALPGDAVGWRLRMRLSEARDLINVPEYPTLDATPDAGDVEPEPPTPRLVDQVPSLARREPPPTVEQASASLIRGIRSERIKSLARRAIQAGYGLAMTGSGHLAISAADGRRLMVVSTTAGDSRRGHTWGNVRAQAKRVGIDVTGL